MTGLPAGDSADKRHQLRNLVVMSIADGSIGQRESNLLADRCVAMGFGEDELRDAIAYAMGDNPVLRLPTLRADKLKLMSDLIVMMAVDGKWDENEKRLFALAAAKMGLTQDCLSELMDAAKTTSSEATP